MKRKWVAQGRYDYMGVDYYECQEVAHSIAGQEFTADHWSCIRNDFCIKPKKLGHAVAAALNAAYWYGREDERAVSAELLEVCKAPLNTCAVNLDDQEEADLKVYELARAAITKQGATP